MTTGKFPRATVLIPPLLLAAYPVIALWANNLGEAETTEVARPLLVSIALALLILLGLRLVLRDWKKAALLTSGALVLFFSYGHIYTAIKSWQIGPLVIGRHRYLLPLWGAILVFWVWWLGRRHRDYNGLLAFFTVAGAAALAFPVATLASYQLQAARLPAAGARQILPQEVNQANPSADARPDIYYIILDGYGRQDILEELYDYDNSSFLEYLNGRGFYIADQSRSNYNKTLLSLASALNMGYVNHLTQALGERSRNNDPLEALIQHSAVRDHLEALGYTTVAFRTGFRRTTIRDADLLLEPPQARGSARTLNGFEGILLETTMAKTLFDSPLARLPAVQELQNRSRYDAHRERIRFTLSQLGEVARMEGPQFVFVHVLAPHPPFVFGSRGEERYPTYAYTLQDGSGFEGSPEAYIQGYRDQVIYINRLIRTAIDEIVANSETPPVILLQGDHGPGAYLDWTSVEETNLEERLSILNAYYLPEGDGGALYPEITPVNSFRVVFNQLFQAGYTLLPDESYFADHIRPFKFIPVSS